MSTDTSRKHNGPLESKYWHVRINDISDEQLERFKNMEDVEYMNIGEIEQNRSRPGSHYHVCIKFNRSRALAYVKRAVLFNKNLHSADYYMATKYNNSTAEQFVGYAIKNGSRIVIGDIEDLNKKGMIEQRKEEIDEKNKLRLHHARILDYDWFIMNDFTYFNSTQCKALLANCQHKGGLQPLEKLDNYYIWGEPGTGKSSLIHYLWPDSYKKIKTNEKWDSYSNFLDGHKTVYFDEINSMELMDQCLGGLEGLKTCTDVYPFNIRSNHGNSQVMIRPERFVYTSNYILSKVIQTPNRYGNTVHNPEMEVRAMMRRFKHMHISEAHIYFNCRFDQKIQRTVPHDWGQEARDKVHERLDKTKKNYKHVEEPIIDVTQDEDLGINHELRRGRKPKSKEEKENISYAEFRRKYK